MVAYSLSLIANACTSHTPPYLTGSLPIEAPRVAYAGDQIEIIIGPVAAHNGTPIGLVMVGTYGPKVYNTVFQSGLAYFTIPSGDTLQPGYLAFIAAADDARGEISIILKSQLSLAGSAADAVHRIVGQFIGEHLAGHIFA